MTPTMRNARITGTHLGDEDYGPTYFIYLDYGGSGQGFGGHHLSGEFTHEAIFRLLNTLGVGSWEKLPGTPVRVIADWGRIHRIGHYLEDKWLSLSELAEELYPAKTDP